jgi:hypothetical protein
MDAIAQIVHEGYLVFLHPKCPARDLRPLQTLDACLSLVSDCVQHDGPVVAAWAEHLQVEAGKLVRMNWTYQRLDLEPIRKPLLVHIDEHGDLLIDCGDTRHMAVMLKDHDIGVPVTVTCRPSDAARFAAWCPVNNDQELLSLSGLGDQGRVWVTRTDGGSDHAASWMEISSPLTRHHLGDSVQRRRMMTNYLLRYRPVLPLDQSWATSAIDWFAYDS